jgi:hypothetical protein
MKIFILHLFFFTQSYIRKLSENYYNKFKLGSNGIIPLEDLPERYGRDYAFYFACNTGNEQCLEDAHTLVKTYAENGPIIPKGLERVYCSGMRSASQATLVSIWQKMQAETDQSFKSTLISALGCARDKKFLFDYMESSLGDGNSVSYTLDERRAVFNSVTQSQVGLEAMTEFLAIHQGNARSRYSYTMLQLYTVVANSIRSRDDQWQFQSFMLSRNELTGNDFQSLSKIINNNLQRQESVVIKQQLEIMARTYPRDGNTTEVRA